MTDIIKYINNHIPSFIVYEQNEYEFICFLNGINDFRLVYKPYRVNNKKTALNFLFLHEKISNEKELREALTELRKEINLLKK